MTEAMKKDDGKKVTLIDNRGVGKPDKYTGKDHESFLRWKLESFIYSIFPEIEEALTWAEEQNDVVTLSRARSEFGPGGGRSEVENLDDKLSQVYAVLQNLLEGEALVIIRNTEKGNGLEGWRKLNRRYDPATGAKKSSLLRHILTPGKCKLEELNEKVEQWMERRETWIRWTTRIPTRRHEDVNTCCCSASFSEACATHLHIYECSCIF